MTFMEHLQALRILDMAQKGGYFEQAATMTETELNDKATELLRVTPPFETIVVRVDRRTARGALRLSFKVYGDTPPEMRLEALAAQVAGK